VRYKKDSRKLLKNNIKVISIYFNSYSCIRKKEDDADERKEDDAYVKESGKEKNIKDTL